MPIIIRIFNDIEENVAYDLEFSLVNSIGIDNLSNIVPGGGVGVHLLGDKNPTKRPEVAKKISESCKGRIPWNKGLRGLSYKDNGNYGKFKGMTLEEIHGEKKASEIKKKQFEKKIGRKNTLETKIKMSKSSILNVEGTKRRISAMLKAREEKFLQTKMLFEDDVLYLHNSGFSIFSISKKLGLTRYIVKKIIEEK
jgi:hypothetical protein